jgi:hypothetical protein
MALALAACLTMGACSPGGEQASDSAGIPSTGDTQPAPATVLTPDNPNRPDSTAGLGDRTMKRGSAGDTLGSRAPGGVKGRTPDEKKRP